MRKFAHLSPSLYPVAGFLTVITLGAVVLEALPTASGTHLSFMDALFMSTSATCVTGLAVVDIGSELTTWGQFTILALIQLGGLGTMTVSTVFLLAMGRSIPFQSRFIVQDIFAHSPQADLHILLRRVILFALSFEAAGTLLLYLRFKDRFEASEALYHAGFHAVSAFCNAGFSLFSNSFMDYRGDVLLNLTVTVLIILGGIGFMVLHEVVRSTRPGSSPGPYWNRLSLHSRLVITMTSSLLALGTVFFLLSEWSNALEGLSLPGKLLASWFQAVTPRTAGFNTLDYASMNNITLLGTLLFMFIGASPGSTGGGIKTTTMGVFLALTRSRLSGMDNVHAFKRSISPETINRAFGIFVLSVVIVLTGTAGLVITEAGTVPHDATRGLFLELLFESVSAFGTVGLSMGVTSQLSPWGKFMLVILMFTGRLGPLVIAMAIQPPRGKGKFLYAEERIMIG